MEFSHFLDKRRNQGVESQITEASQIITNIDSIDSKSAYAKVSNRILRRNPTTVLLNILTRVAAVLFVPALIASLWLYNQPLSPMNLQTFATQEISSPPGVRTKVILPDGSRVWLNAESTLKFKLPFDKTSREIVLSGEAYFDVMKNPNSPFFVQSGKARVKVFGTRFNFKAFEEENNVEVVLEEGKVSLNTGDTPGANDLIMKPGDRAVFDRTNLQTKLTRGKIDQYLAWHDGKLVFDETPMQEVATQLSRWYGIEVIIEDPGIRKYRITTTFDNESLHQVLELLRLSSPIEIQYVAAAVDNETKEQTKSKVIFTGKKLIKTRRL
jgi:ferric-dicitrate binding protein FerR (iron transport regulator)